MPRTVDGTPPTPPAPPMTEPFAAAPGERARRTDRLAGRILVGLGVAVLLARVAIVAHRGLLVDDAFISFRYAANLAHGAGLVFNPGERVEGYTNFLWTVLLAAGIRCGVDPGVLAVALSVLAAAATVVLLADLLTRLLRPSRLAATLGGCGGLLYAAMGSQARLAVSGLETVFFVLLLVLAWDLAVARGRPGLAALAFAAAALTRPEGALYWGLTLAWYALCSARERAGDEGASRPGRLRGVVAFALPFVVVCGVYFAWRYRYYGDLLPNTFYAKASDPSLGRLARGGRLLGEIAAIWGVYPLALLALAGLVPGRAARRAQAAALLWGWLIVAATAGYFVSIGGDFLVFFGPRLLLPALPALLLLAAVGLERITPEAGRLGAGARTAVGLFLVVNALWWSWPARFYRLDGQALEIEAWSRIGRWLAAHTPPGATVATGAAGAIPYYSRRRTLDMFGLVDRHIAHLHLAASSPNDPPAHEKYDPRYVLLQRPDVIVATHVDAAGRATTAGLDQVQDAMDACYRLAAVAKSQRPWPADGRWIVAVPPYARELAAEGYKTGIFVRREGADAEGCDGTLRGLAGGR